MALTDIEAARVRRALKAYVDKRRPPAHIRDQLDIGARLEGQSVVLFEVRPIWRGPPGKKHELPYAKSTYVRTKDHWRVFWRRSDLKWHSYEPAPQVSSIDAFLELVERDEYHCFHG